jgi:ATP-dependent Clp protease adaptor protein ClpS
MSDNDRRGGSDGPNTGVVVKARPKTRKPPMYKVLMLNDDYTPMEFVVHVLERFFQKSREEATRIMLHVHRRGVGVCGVYTYEVAETKVTQVMDLARQNREGMIGRTILRHPETKFPAIPGIAVDKAAHGAQRSPRACGDGFHIRGCRSVAGRH